MKILSSLLMATVSAAALSALAPAAALAQEQGDVEQVVVTASRITSGYQQPTPVTVVGVQQLEREAKPDIGDVVRQLPQVGGGAPQAGSNANVIAGANPGASTLTLRGLGISRTLVLFDGQRMIASAITGGVDLNTIPSSLVERVDVVTAGASSAWGSDAVAGVINLVLNRKFTGLKGNVEATTNEGNAYPSYKAEASYGFNFAGGRGHAIISGAHVDTPKTVFLGNADWNQLGAFVVPNPAFGNGSATRYKTIHNAGLAQATAGGLIVSNPAGTTPGSANILRGLQFKGPNATVSPFDFGTVAGIISYGGSSGFYDNLNPYRPIALPYRTNTLFAYGKYDLTDNVTASVQLNYGDSWARNSSGTAANFGNLTIRSDNPYIPDAVRNTMTANGITSFVMGTLNSNNVQFGPQMQDISLKNHAKSLSFPVQDSKRNLKRGVFTLEGKLGSDWTWNAYGQAAEVGVDQVVINNTLRARLTQAQDAVRVTAANVGNSGLPVGSIQCRVKLTTPSSGCIPVNVFGEGVAAPDAIAWINSYDNLDYQNTKMNQEVVAASMSGRLPFALAAGPIATAFGAEYRRERGNVVADPRGVNAEWANGNFSNFNGRYSVREAFAEVEVPLLKDSVVKSLIINGAGRVTDYSTSGTVETWKVGLSSELNDSVRVRGTISRDIRAPNLSELFSSHAINVSIQTDPKTGQSVNAFNDTSGNPDLKPEIGRTLTAGVVVRPSFLPALTASLDWYKIRINGAISTPSANSVTALCAAGDPLYCAQLDFNGPNGALSTVHTRPINSAFASVEGLDTQIDYHLPVGPGDLALRFVGNYNIDSISTTLGVACSTAGTAGLNSPNCAGGPRFTGVLSGTYTLNDLTLGAQLRYKSAYKLNKTWVEGVDVDNNDLPSQHYLDLRASYKLGEHLQLYGTIDNVLGADPLVIPAFYNQGNAHAYTFGDGDLLGRVFRAGLRFNY